MATEQPKRARAKKRNFARELADLKMYCSVKVDVLKSIDKSGEDPLWKSSIEAYEDVLQRISV